MRKKINLILSILSYVISFIMILFYVRLIIKVPSFEVSSLVFLLLLCVFVYFGGFFLSKYLNNNKPMKINLWIFLILYLFLLVDLTLFNQSFNRMSNNFNDFKSYLLKNTNIIPFKTIFSYISKFDSMYNTKDIMFNLIGNICAFMPIALLLPLLFKDKINFKKIIITLVLMILGVELLQLLLKVGRFDVDDFILNLLGAVILYLILNIKSVKSLIHNTFLLEHNKISVKSYIKIISFIIIVLIAFIVLILYRNKLYNQNLDDFNKINNPMVTFKYDNNCSENNLFYEDEIYKYYFNCYDSDNFYVMANDEVKLSVKDFLDNSKYNYDINRLLEDMDYNNINYKIEHKFTHFNIKIDNENEDSISFSENVDSDIAKLVIVDKSKDVKTLDYEINIVPIKRGTKPVELSFGLTDEDGNTKTITKKFKIIVDENLNVSYNEEWF